MARTGPFLTPSMLRDGRLLVEVQGQVGEQDAQRRLAGHARLPQQVLAGAARRRRDAHGGEHVGAVGVVDRVVGGAHLQAVGIDDRVRRPVGARRRVVESEQVDPAAAAVARVVDGDLDAPPCRRRGSGARIGALAGCRWP